MTVEHHDCDVWLDEETWSTTEGRWVAACSCGWEAKERFDDAEHAKAVERWETHCDAVFMEATTTGLGEERGR